MRYRLSGQNALKIIIGLTLAVALVSAGSVFAGGQAGRPGTGPRRQLRPDAAAVARAQVVVENGLGYDAYMDQLRSTGAVGPRRTVVAAEVLGAIRKAKSDAKVSMRAEVSEVRVADTPVRLAALRAAEADVLGAGRAASGTGSMWLYCRASPSGAAPCADESAAGACIASEPRDGAPLDPSHP